jgi:hypothetical protein
VRRRFPVKLPRASMRPATTADPGPRAARA